MRLTQIKLAGFKSFTDPTTIHVPAQLVAVIGPNGCGKSNVIDAVRWVLGEASAKQLRGESMQDVIFNGAATRRPAPRASVELVFDNSDHSLQGAWGQYAEVSIKRQLTRQGDSSYFINNQAVRRRDITDLFLGTGVGARGYAVIEQGMISRIIEARPEELRTYIEEAAGVSKYKERRRETETRLKDTREHLQRLADLQNELVRQVDKLNKQAATAAQYQHMQSQLSQQQNLLDYAQWQNALTEADQAQAQHQQAQLAAESLQNQQDEIQQNLNQLRETEQQQQQQLHSLNQEHAVLREQMARLEEQWRARQNQQQRMERERNAAQMQLQKIQQEQISIHSQSELIAADIADKQQELSEWAMQVAEHETLLPEMEQAQHEQQIAAQHQQEQLSRIKRELALKQQQNQHIENSLIQLSTRQKRLSDEQNALNLPNDDELEQAQIAAETQQQHYEHSEQGLLNSENALQQQREAFQAAQNQYAHIQQQVLTLQAEHQALTQLLQSQHNADAWANTPHHNAPAVWQKINIHADWQHALSVVLTSRLSAKWLPENPQQHLPEQNAAWINVAGSLKNKAQPAQALLNQIQADKSIQAALNDWLDGILCAPDLAYALSQQNQLQNNQLWLTPEGHRIDKHSVWLFDSGSQNILQQQTRCDEISTQLHIRQPEMAAAQQQLEKLKQENQILEQQYREQQQQHRQYAAALQQAQNAANELFARTNQGQLRREHIRQELQQIAEEMQQLQHNQRSLQQDIHTLSTSSETLSEQQNQLSGSLNAAQQRTKQAQLALLEANRQYGMAQLSLNKQQQQLDSLNTQLSVLEQQKLDWQERQSELALEQAHDANDDEQREQLEALHDLSQHTQEHILQANNALQQTQQQAKLLLQQQQECHFRLPEIQQNVQQALLQQQEALLNAKRYHDNLLEKQADIEQLSQQAANFAQPEQMLREIAQLNQKIQSLGAVNLAALDELKEAQERDEYYRTQSQDVQAAIDLLSEAIAQIDGETKVRFKQTFDAVNEKVQSFFPALFGGGQAQLHIIGDDLLTAGVAIMARPPGKKNSTIHLLSGGEKALTAMSLVFALFSLNPAPFCLLDEVDAPLDDANTSRFCDLVKEMSAQTQFLYISHNRLTMEMAEQLVGVTMQEKGVSRIVAVDIQQALQMANV